MARHDAEGTRAVESALLWLSQDPAAFAWALGRIAPESALAKVLRRAGLPVPPQGAADGIARALARLPHLPQQLARLLLECAPQTAATPLPAPAAAAEFDPASAPPERWRLALCENLLLGNAAGAQEIRALHALLGERLAPAPEPASATHRRRVPAPRTARTKPKTPTPQETLAQTQDQLAGLQQELTSERTRRRELAEELEAARATSRADRTRATDFKKRLAAARDPSERERALEDAAAQAQHELSVLTQKFRLIEEERDDLRACLEDSDRFNALPAENVASFRSRPLLSEELALGGRIAADGRAFRILVVGGGEPQHRHREKLAEYSEVLGFLADWRMAEYVSWHRELDKLRADMRNRFDALVILHYNRTTFTRHARGICDEAGHKPCMTCRYEGFTSLRASLRECLRQLLERP
jgi:hypothetical protein